MAFNTYSIWGDVRDLHPFTSSHNRRHYCICERHIGCAGWSRTNLEQGYEPRVFREHHSAKLEQGFIERNGWHEATPYYLQALTGPIRLKFI